MRILLTRASVLTVAVLLIATAVSFGGGVPAAVHYIGHDKVTGSGAATGIWSG